MMELESSQKTQKKMQLKKLKKLKISVDKKRAPLYNTHC